MNYHRLVRYHKVDFMYCVVIVHNFTVTKIVLMFPVNFRDTQRRWYHYRRRIARCKTNVANSRVVIGEAVVEGRKYAPARRNFTGSPHKRNSFHCRNNIKLIALFKEPRFKAALSH